MSTNLQTIFINIITYNNDYGLTRDIKIISDALHNKFDTIYILDIKIYNFFDYESRYCHINIFLETVSYILHKYAKINILIPNQEWYYKSWIPYISLYDYVLAKTVYAHDIFSNYRSKDDTHVIGWQSSDLYLEESDNAQIIKDYSQCLHVCGKSIYKSTQILIDLWTPDLPQLTIIYSPNDVKLKLRDVPNIKYITSRLNDESFNYMLNSIGIHICTSTAEGWGHYIHESKSTKAVVISTKGQPMDSYFTDGVDGFLVNSKKIRLKEVMGSQYSIDPVDFINVLKKVLSLHIIEKERIGEKARESFLKTNKEYIKDIDTLFTKIFQDVRSLQNPNTLNLLTKIKSNPLLLPHISIVTPTFNRSKFFKLGIYNFNNINYPKDKLEWIILDDSDNPLDVINMREYITRANDSRIKYEYIPERQTIGWKRNKLVELSKHSIIMHMDDDDFYPKDSVYLRLLYLENSGHDCVFCSTIGCFEINKFVSMINVPPHKLPLYKRVSEASLCYYKRFWTKQKYSDSSKGAEAEEFLKNREKYAFEVSWKNILVVLLHKGNVSKKEIPDTPNGSYFNFTDDEFLFITDLDK